MQNIIVRLPDAKSRPLIEALYPGQIHAFSKHHALICGADASGFTDKATLLGMRAYRVIDKGTLEKMALKHNPRIITGECGPLPRRVRIHRGSSSKDPEKTLFNYKGQGYVTRQPANIERIEQLEKFANTYFGNVSLMGALHYLHEQAFCRPKTVVDLFTGEGGSIIAGIQYGATRIVGFEIDKERFKKIRANLETHLEDEGVDYTARSTPDQAIYQVKQGKGIEVRIVRANSITQGPAIIKSLALNSYEVIMDMPWGPKQCLAVTDRRLSDTKEMDELDERVAQALTEMGAKRASVALHKSHRLPLPEVRRIASHGGIYAVAQYNLSLR